MAFSSHALVFSFSLVCFVGLFLSSFAQLELQQQQLWQNLALQQQHRVRGKTQCRIERLTAQEPRFQFQSEAGTTDFWDSDSPEFECAGIQFIRHVIQPKGLLLPYYTNTPQLIYIIQGSGIQSTVVPGCAETYESPESESSQWQGQGQGQSSFTDRHQKLRRFREGDVLALPAGVTHWTYNDGGVPIVSVSLLDVSNEDNQLDLNFRKFFLAGNPQQSRQQPWRGPGGGGGGGQQQPWERQEEGHGRHEEMGRQEGRGQEGQRGRHEYGGNILSGFGAEILSQVFKIDTELVRRIQGQQDQRGIIVRAERLNLILPEYGQEERQRQQEYGGGSGGRRPLNGLEETLCTIKLRENIGHPAQSDLYNPHAGRISTLNSQTLPVLSMLQLSAERGVLYRNALMAPHWNLNAHSAVYVIRGSGRIQVVGSHGRAAFDDEVREGQLIIVPQNFAVLKQAGNQGLEWISFKTNDNAMTSQLAGRLSALRSMPDAVLLNSYQISREEARSLKFNRQEATLLAPRSRSPRD